MKIINLIKKHNKYYSYYPDDTVKDVLFICLDIFYITFALYISLLTNNYKYLSISLFASSFFLAYRTLNQKYKINEINNNVKYIKLRCDLILDMSSYLLTDLSSNKTVSNVFYSNKIESFKSKIDLYSNKIKKVEVDNYEDFNELIELKEEIMNLFEYVSIFEKRLQVKI